MSSSVCEEPIAEQVLLTSSEISLTKATKVPHHIAIAMDGNRRWASRRFMPALVGHWKGADAITKVVRAASDLGVKVLTLYAFSTENWNRSESEGVRLDSIGDLSKLPQDVQDIFFQTKMATKDGKKIDLVLAVNYGGRDDIRRATLAIVGDFEKGLLKKEDISEDLISSYLDTAKWKDPDLFIRTSGEQRLSNFLLWQFSYTEVYITKTLWPDFNEKHLLQAVLEYQQRERRLGGA